MPSYATKGAKEVLLTFKTIDINAPCVIYHLREKAQQNAAQKIEPQTFFEGK